MRIHAGDWSRRPGWRSSASFLTRDPPFAPGFRSQPTPPGKPDRRPQNLSSRGRREGRVRLRGNGVQHLRKQVSPAHADRLPPTDTCNSHRNAHARRLQQQDRLKEADYEADRRRLPIHPTRRLPRTGSPFSPASDPIRGRTPHRTMAIVDELMARGEDLSDGEGDYLEAITRFLAEWERQHLLESLEPRQTPRETTAPPDRISRNDTPQDPRRSHRQPQRRDDASQRPTRNEHRPTSALAAHFRRESRGVPSTPPCSKNRKLAASCSVENLPS